jgi:Mrp family chromosome partitioning ATPase
MGLEGGAGLTDVLVGRASLAEVIQRWGSDQLYVLAAGRIPPNPNRLLGSSAMQALHRALVKQYDFVIFDSPPMLPTTDAFVLSRTVESEVILLGAIGNTRKRNLASAIKNLESMEAQILGLILTMAPNKVMEAYGYGDYSDAAIYYSRRQLTKHSRRSLKTRHKATSRHTSPSATPMSNPAPTLVTPPSGTPIHDWPSPPLPHLTPTPEMETETRV